MISVPFSLRNNRALAKMRHIPDESWTDVFWRRSYRLIPEMEPRHMIVTITALVALGQAPPGTKWFTKFCEVIPLNRPFNSGMLWPCISCRISAQIGSVFECHSGPLRVHECACSRMPLSNISFTHSAIKQISGSFLAVLSHEERAGLLRAFACLERSPGRPWFTAFFR